jgi:hypothetical protein
MNSIADILANAGIPFKLAPHRNVRRGWLGTDCPRCSPYSNKFKLGFELSTGRAHCWTCGGMYGPEVLAQILHQPQKEVYQLLGELPKYRSKQEDVKHHGTLKIPPGVGELLPAHRVYLERERKLDPDVVSRTWNLKGIGIGGRLQWRIFIPIHDEYGVIVSWTTRSVGKNNPLRYCSATEEEEAYPHKSLLYGAHLARHTIIILEGPVDVWTIGPGAVATLGVGYSAKQKQLMMQYPVRIVCFDAEDDAQDRAEQLCKELSTFPGKTENLLLETGKDPNAADREEIQELRLRYFPELYGSAV